MSFLRFLKKLLDKGRVSSKISSAQFPLSACSTPLLPGGIPLTQSLTLQHMAVFLTMCHPQSYLQPLLVSPVRTQIRQRLLPSTVGGQTCIARSRLRPQILHPHPVSPPLVLLELRVPQVLLLLSFPRSNLPSAFSSFNMIPSPVIIFLPWLTP